MATHKIASGLRATLHLGRGVRNALIDLRHGHLLDGRWKRPADEDQAHQHTDHIALRRTFDGLVRPGDVLVDIGCGRGRMLEFWSARFPDHQVIGVEAAPDVAASTARRMRRHPNCTVLSGDVIELLPTGGTLFYLHDPFGREQIEALRIRLAALPRSSRPLLIVYHDPEHLEVFADRPAWRTVERRLGGGRLAPHDDVAVISRSY